jgi:hypothetical protein
MDVRLLILSWQFNTIHQTTTSMTNRLMLKRNITLAIFFVLAIVKLDAQKSITNYIFGHSLIHHEFQVNPTPSQETSVPHWMHFLSDAAGHQYEVSGQYGFLPQHDNLPPFAQWGFDFVPGAWDSDYETFADADFNTIIITPGNFIQWQSPTLNYPGESVSPISATEDIFEWCIQQESSLNFYIYENWPDMGPFLNNGFPPTESEWNAYNENLNNEFHDWFIDYHNSVSENFPDACVSLIPVGSLISSLLSAAPFNEIEVSDLYEDDAPHGQASIYFLSALITYMTIYEEMAPLDYTVESIVHPVIAENYEVIVETFWNDLNEFSLSDDSEVFCNEPLIVSSLSESIDDRTFVLRPNPAHQYISIDSKMNVSSATIFDLYGNAMLDANVDSMDNSTIDVSNLESGMYILFIRDESNMVTSQRKFIKQ